VLGRETGLGPSTSDVLGFDTRMESNIRKLAGRPITELMFLKQLLWDLVLGYGFLPYEGLSLQKFSREVVVFSTSQRHGFSADDPRRGLVWGLEHNRLFSCCIFAPKPFLPGREMSHDQLILVTLRNVQVILWPHSTKI
jgi:hypothetical protein